MILFCIGVVIEIPIFPLQAIVFPDGFLPLRIFEPRYTDMVSECMKNNHGFAVCAVSNHQEEDLDVGFYTIGTLVEISDFKVLPDGLLGITVYGKEKIQVLNSRIKPNELIMGDITLLPEEPYCPLLDKHRLLSQMLERILPDVQEAYGDEELKYAKMDLSNAAWVGSRLVEFLPIELNIKQILLECNDSNERLDILYEALQNMGVI